jgi:hypothetical protein
MHTITFDEYVDVLRERLYDHEATQMGGSELPNFPALMSDYAEVAPPQWSLHAYEELQAQGHLSPQASGLAMGPTPFGRLSADGRYFVLQGRKHGQDGEAA